MAAHVALTHYKDPAVSEQQQAPTNEHKGSTGAAAVVKAQPLAAPFVTAQMGPAQMLAQETANGKMSRTALVHEVAQLKERLAAIAKATGYNMAHAKDGAGKTGMTGKAAADDMQNFWAKMTAGHGSSDGSTRVINTAHDANRQLGRFFDSLPVGGKKGGGGHAAETLPAGAQHMSPYDKEYVASVQKKYGDEAAQQVVDAAEDGHNALVVRKDGQGECSIILLRDRLPHSHLLCCAPLPVHLHDCNICLRLAAPLPGVGGHERRGLVRALDRGQRGSSEKRSGGEVTLGLAADTQGQGAGFGGDAKMTGKEAAHALDDYWKHMPTEVLVVMVCKT